MTNKPKKIRQYFNKTFILVILMISTFSGALVLLANLINSTPENHSISYSEQDNVQLGTDAPPSQYPTYTGAGTPRVAQESLWRTLSTQGYANLPITFDLPGFGYWQGTRIDLTITNIYERQDWITDGNFESWPTGWGTNTDPTHTGPAITISADTGYITGATSHQQASRFKFAANQVISPSPPQSSSSDPNNEGDLGSTNNWTAGTNLGGGVPQAWNNGMVTGRNSGGPNNRDGVWEFYISDAETHTDPDLYTVTYTATYHYTYWDFPVSTASFAFDYYYYSTDFDQGPACAGGYDADRDRFVLSYRVFTRSISSSEITVVDWQSSGATDPGNPGWQTITPVDVTSLFALEDTGDGFGIEFKLVIYFDVDDGRSDVSNDCCEHDTWCSYASCVCCGDANNEDSDYLYVWIDGLELTCTIPEMYGSDVDPDFSQTISGFDGRNTTDGYLSFDYFIPSNFLCGKAIDNNLYLDVVINSVTHRYSIKNTLTHDDAWHTLVLNWATIGPDIGQNPGPSSFVLEFSIVFTAFGWYAKGTDQSVWIDNVVLWLENYAPADLVGLKCYDDAEHGSVEMSWNTTTEYISMLSYSGTWQTGVTSTTFWLNKSTSASLWISSLTATFYAANHYPTITPMFSIPTDSDGLTPTVTWTITHNVQAISSGWRYNLTIPNIPAWNANDWDVVSIKDPTNQDIDYWEIPAGGNMKNISIYEANEDTTGNWVITCTSPNKITAFNIQNQASATDYEYDPGASNASRITFTTGTRNSANSLILVNYTDPSGNPVDPAIYPNTTIQPNTAYIMPYWNIPNDAIGNDHYIAMVKWIDNDGAFNDEVGFAAHYVQVYRAVTVSPIQFYQSHTTSSSNIVLAGEQIQISVDVTDLIISPSLALDSVQLVVDYLNKTNPSQILQKTLAMSKTGNTYSYTITTDGSGGSSWLANDAWMGGVGNRTISINLFGNSTYLNGAYQYYQLNGWFHILVDTEYNLPDPDESVEQGISFTLAVELWDNTPAHNPAITGKANSDKINNRTIGAPITDLNGDGYADTWNGSVHMYWSIIPSNLSNWFGGNMGNYNNPNYKWNGTMTLKDGTSNRYEARIRVPADAEPSKPFPSVWYYVNVTTYIYDNEWGWKFETMYMTLTYDQGYDTYVLATYDDHIGCFKLDVEEALGFDTKLTVEPANTLSSPLQQIWKDPDGQLTRLYVRFFNLTNNVGFNSSTLALLSTGGGSWKVESWVSDLKVPDSYGTDLSRIQWSLVTSSTLLPDGITPDPHQENPANNNTWGWFYADYNWTEVNLGAGTYEGGLLPASFEIYLYAKIDNITTPYKASEKTHYITVNPNPVNLTIALRYQGNPSLLDPNYYLGQIPELKYYWGDILNFTIRAADTILNQYTAGISLRYYIYQQGGDLITWGDINDISGGLYSKLFNTSDPANGITYGDYHVYFRGILGNHSIQPITAFTLILNRRNTQLWPLLITGVFDENSVTNYANIEDIRSANSPRQFDPIYTLQTVPNQIITFSVQVLDGTPRNYTSSNVIQDANVSWYLRLRGSAETQWRLAGWSNTSDKNGIYTFVINLSQMYPAFTEGDYGDTFELHIIPRKTNFDSTEDTRYEENNPGSAWKQYIVIHKRPIAIIPIDPITGAPKWDYQNSQSNWKYNPIYFVVMDLVTGDNITGCTVFYEIGEITGSMQEVQGTPGLYYVVFDTWPSTFNWESGGQKWLEAQIISGPPSGLYGTYSAQSWDIARLAGNFKVSIYVESEGFLGPLTIYFYIILGIVGAVLGAYYSYKSYKFLTTPYVVRKIEESIDKISKDKKIAAGVMKSRDHLIFLQATELLQVVGVALKPPPEKKLPPPIEKIIKAPEVKVEKIPDIPMEIVSAELDKAGVRPEEKPILLSQIGELGPGDKREFIESLIGEDRFKEIIEDLKLKEASKVPKKEN